MTEIRDQRVVILMTKDEADAIEEWMHANRIKSRSAAIRELCILGMSHSAVVEFEAGAISFDDMQSRIRLERDMKPDVN